MTRFFTELLTIGNMVAAFEVPGVEGVVSYSTAIRLNLRFRRVFGLRIGKIEFIFSSVFRTTRTGLLTYRVGLKFSFSESDSKLPNRHDCRAFSANLKFCRSSESLSIEFVWHSFISLGPSAGLLELSSVGCGAHAAQNKYIKLVKRVPARRYLTQISRWSRASAYAPTVAGTYTWCFLQRQRQIMWKLFHFVSSFPILHVDSIRFLIVGRVHVYLHHRFDERDPVVCSYFPVWLSFIEAAQSMRVVY